MHWHERLTSAGTLAWQYTGSGNNSPGALTLTIERAAPVNATARESLELCDVVSTRVTISYPYTWQLSRVIRFLVPGCTYAGRSPVKAEATVPNLD